MSSLVASVLNATVGLLLNIARNNTAKKLKDGGDLTDVSCRKLIVRELDDIKDKLDALARVSLSSSIHFLKEGVSRLDMCLEKSSNGETISAQEQTENNGQRESAAMEACKDRYGERSVINEALALSREIGTLKINSEQRFEFAKESFKEGRKEATRAFSNEALSMDDRITATKLRMVSRILEGLDDPDAAAKDCMLYLEELHAMSAIKGIFSVHISGGFKSRFNKTKRLESVKAVTKINFALFDFTKKFTKIPQHLYEWPTIVGTFHPLSYKARAILSEVIEYGQQAPYQLAFEEEEDDIRLCSLAVNSKEEIIIKRNRLNNSVNIINNEGQSRLFCCLPKEDTEASGFYIWSLAIDGEDNVYIAKMFRQTDGISSVYNYKLFVFDANGNIKHQSPLEFLRGKDECVRIAVNEDKNIIIHKTGERYVYVCDSSGQLKYSFLLEKKLNYRVHLSISDRSEIIAAQRYKNTVYIYTKRGKLTRKIKLPRDHQVYGVAFNHITKKIIVHAWDKQYSSHLLIYSETGELQIFPFPYVVGNITSHPNGPVAFVQNTRVIVI